MRLETAKDEDVFYQGGSEKRCWCKEADERRWAPRSSQEQSTGQRGVVVLPSGSMAGASGDPQVYSSRTESEVGVARAIPGECRAVLCCADCGGRRKKKFRVPSARIKSTSRFFFAAADERGAEDA
jgi:hypothetical protein